MKYADITDQTSKKRIRRVMRQTHLCKSIFRDVTGILNILLPSDKGLKIGEHIKSIMYALVELATGLKSENF